MSRVAFVSAFHGIELTCRFRSQTIGHRNLKLAPARLIRCVSQAKASQVSNEGRGNNAPKGKAVKRSKRKDQSPYSSTVNLPKTAFEQRANSVKREPELQQFWAENRIYEILSRENPGDTFVLHDGPPFANGPLHCGHALNKILKDIINKWQLMKGSKAVFVPGWDTHGLPIELKVLQSMKSKERKGLSVPDLRKRAREFATETVSKHIVGMKRFGVWADWDNPYLTLQPEYEAAQIEVFGLMYEAGYVFKGRKPVHWSPSSRTALAEAELEYPEGHTSRSCYCAFSATSVPNSAPQIVRDAFSGPGGLALSIWTTTPWTIPANRAVAVNTGLKYALVKGLNAKNSAQVVVLAEDLLETVLNKTNSGSVSVLGFALGEDLLGIEYQHPLEEGLICRVVEGGDYITTETGTGLVHTAPGHGQEDYQTALREGLAIVAPVDDAGKFTDEAANGRFTGLSVLSEGNDAVLKALDEGDVLMLEEKYSHKYPYDWRTKKPTISRATEQWFISIESFRKDVLEAIENVEWFPTSGIKRIRGMVEGRGDWCISRQRSWGVPIPVFNDDSTGEAFMSIDIVNHVRDIFKERGSDAWWELEADELLPEEYRGRGLKKGRDTMDVWFDSGSSWNGVTSARPELAYPADIYLEGSDQHRGWFQSSMLTSIAVRKQAPYKKVLTHGFVLDENGIKMSKSIGNVIDPLQVIEGGNNKKTHPAYGSDVLRLWVASVDYSADIMIGPMILRQVADVYKKLRNTLRYMAGNIHDFSPKESAVPYESLPAIDRYILSRLCEVLREVETAYDSFAFCTVYQALQRFAVVDLSNFYLDIAKDRLYIPEVSAFRRRSCQTVLAILLENYARVLAPILPHTAEDLWQSLPYAPKSTNSEFQNAKSIFQAGWFNLEDNWVNVDKGVLRNWQVVLEVRDAVHKVLETARMAKTLGASMEASVKIYVKDPSDLEILRELSECKRDVDSLHRALIVSEVEILPSLEDLKSCAHTNLEEGSEKSRFIIGIDKCTTPKCDRCWHFDGSVGVTDSHPALCSRCADAVIKMGILAVPTEVAAAAL